MSKRETETSYYQQFVMRGGRQFIMGCAILLVLLFHILVWTDNPIGVFNVGFIGVDIFLFLSGAGLTFSYRKHPVSKFYLNRMLRVYPVFAVSVLLSCLLIEEAEFSYVWQNLTTLGYYIDGGQNRFDWYLESLFLLYLLFPIFYHLGGRYWRFNVSIVFAISTAVLYLFDLPWWYDCFISRVYFFLLGVVFVRNAISDKEFLAIIIAGLLLALPLRIYVSQFLSISCLALLLMFALVKIKRHLNKKSILAIERCGCYTLEIYCANVLSLSFADYMGQTNLYGKLLCIIIGQILFTVILIQFNKIVFSRIKSS